MGWNIENIKKLVISKDENVGNLKHLSKRKVS
jgi:hypothetical protein